MTEADFIARLRDIATDPAARGLADDTAVLGDLVLTHDMIVEGVHFLPDERPEDVAWKLVAVNLSDLAAKGATPLGVLLGYTLSGDAEWDERFARGLDIVLRRYGLPLLGGDTVGVPAGAPRSFGLTAIGKARPEGAPSRGGMKPGDRLWVSGTIGNAGVGLAMRLGEVDANETCLGAYSRPQPQLTLGQALIFWASGRDQLIPRELVYPPDKSRDEIDEANTKDFLLRQLAFQMHSSRVRSIDEVDVRKMFEAELVKRGNLPRGRRWRGEARTVRQHEVDPLGHGSRI